jgi:hypothetical protein
MIPPNVFEDPRGELELLKSSIRDDSSDAIFDSGEVLSIN